MAPLLHHAHAPLPLASATPLAVGHLREVYQHPTVADCALLPLLSLLEVADPFAGTLALLDPHPGLLAYRERAEQDPVLGRTPKQMRAAFQMVMARLAGQTA